MRAVVEHAPAKVNLDLRVCRRRDDGYHDLDSLVVFTEVGDRLSFTIADSLCLSIDGPFASELKGEPDNLVLGAARLLAEKAGRTPGVRISLRKNLPVAAGLGGGSSDAAAALRGLARLWGLSAAQADLVSVARELGADVPACLEATPTRMRGIGDHLTPFKLPARLSLLLMNPRQAVPTPQVFKALAHLSTERRPVTRLDSIESFHADLRQSVNDLEAPAKRLAPIIGDVLDLIKRSGGCLLARMSGSGATCFGLFDHQDSLDDATRKLRAVRPDWWIVKTGCR